MFSEIKNITPTYGAAPSTLLKLLDSIQKRPLGAIKFSLLTYRPSGFGLRGVFYTKTTMNKLAMDQGLDSKDQKQKYDYRKLLKLSHQILKLNCFAKIEIFFYVIAKY